MGKKKKKSKCFPEVCADIKPKDLIVKKQFPGWGLPYIKKVTKK